MRWPSPLRDQDAIISIAFNYLKFNKPNKQNVVVLIYLINSTFLNLKTTVDTLIDDRNETSKHHFFKIS